MTADTLESRARKFALGCISVPLPNEAVVQSIVDDLVKFAASEVERALEEADALAVALWETMDTDGVRGLLSKETHTKAVDALTAYKQAAAIRALKEEPAS